jgi:hypothetical protein
MKWRSTSDDIGSDINKSAPPLPMTSKTIARFAVQWRPLMAGATPIVPAPRTPKMVDKRNNEYVYENIQIAESPDRVRDQGPACGMISQGGVWQEQYLLSPRRLGLFITWIRSFLLSRTQHLSNCIVCYRRLEAGKTRRKFKEQSFETATCHVTRRSSESSRGGLLLCS